MTNESCQGRRSGRAGDTRSERGERRHGRRHGRKERVLHTRISDELADDIRRMAEELRVPASNLVRNVLEEVFSVVERVSDDVGGLFDDVLEEAELARDRVRSRARERRARSGRGAAHSEAAAERPAAAEPARAAEAARAPEAAAEGQRGGPEEVDGRFDDVFGWQPIVLNRKVSCASCHAALERGERVAVGLGETGPRFDIVLCRSCKAH